MGRNGSAKKRGSKYQSGLKEFQKWAAKHGSSSDDSSPVPVVGGISQAKRRLLRAASSMASLVKKDAKRKKDKKRKKARSRSSSSSTSSSNSSGNQAKVVGKEQQAGKEPEVELGKEQHGWVNQGAVQEKKQQWTEEEKKEWAEKQKNKKQWTGEEKQEWAEKQQQKKHGAEEKKEGPQTQQQKKQWTEETKEDKEKKQWPASTAAAPATGAWGWPVRKASWCDVCECKSYWGKGDCRTQSCVIKPTNSIEVNKGHRAQAWLAKQKFKKEQAELRELAARADQELLEDKERQDALRSATVQPARKQRNA
jgi:hypothetical protein